jgi:hypothetical protein
VRHISSIDRSIDRLSDISANIFVINIFNANPQVILTQDSRFDLCRYFRHVGSKIFYSDGHSTNCAVANQTESVYRDGILKFLRSPGIDTKESIPPAYLVCAEILEQSMGGWGWGG